MTTTTEQAQTADGKSMLNATNGFILLAKIKSGQADALRAELKEMAKSGTFGAALAKTDIVHFARVAIIEEKYFLFESFFDGSAEDYLDDFYSFGSGENFDKWLRYCEGWPGPHDQKAFVDFWMSHKIDDLGSVSAYGGATVKQMHKALRIRNNFEAVLQDFE